MPLNVDLKFGFGPLKSREESPLCVFKTGNFFISAFLFCVLHRDRVVRYCQVRDCKLFRRKTCLRVSGMVTSSYLSGAAYLIELI